MAAAEHEHALLVDASTDAVSLERRGRTRPVAYTRVQVLLHWLVAALVVEQYGTSGAIVRTHTMHLIGQRQAPSDLVLHTMHNRFGLLLTALMIVRLFYRLWAGAPVPGAYDVKRSWASRTASAVHATFYVVLISEGVAGAVASYLWWPASTLHVVLFKALLALLGLHVAAVILHLLAGKSVLGRMGWRRVHAFSANWIARPATRREETGP